MHSFIWNITIKELSFEDVLQDKNDIFSSLILWNKDLMILDDPFLFNEHKSSDSSSMSVNNMYILPSLLKKTSELLDFKIFSLYLTALSVLLIYLYFIFVEPTFTSNGITILQVPVAIFAKNENLI